MRWLLVIFLVSTAVGQNDVQNNAMHAGDSFTTDRPTPATTAVIETMSKPRHAKRLLLLAGSVIFGAAADQYDIRETEIGLRHGVAIEGNSWLVGTHPTYGALMKRDTLLLGLTATPSALGWFFRKKILFYSQLGDPAINGVEHIRAGDAWRKLLGQ
jgi:hypothetical protein